jgi:hypothetical protein
VDAAQQQNGKSFDDGCKPAKVRHMSKGSHVKCGWVVVVVVVVATGWGIEN